MVVPFLYKVNRVSSLERIDANKPSLCVMPVSNIQNVSKTIWCSNAIISCLVSLEEYVYRSIKSRY